MENYLLFRNISDRLSPGCESFVVLRLLPLLPFELGVGNGIHNELLSALVFDSVALASVAAPLAAAIAAALAAAATAAVMLLFVAVLLLLLFSLTTDGGRRVKGTIFCKLRKTKEIRNEAKDDGVERINVLERRIQN